MNLIEQARLAKIASRQLRAIDGETRNKVLLDFAKTLLASKDEILKENAADVAEARQNGMSQAMVDRLVIDDARLAAIAEGVRQVAALEDPVGKVLEERQISCGIHLKKVSVPIGVIGIIFESRPNVTADCAALCFKAGSACVLKGGKESYRSCKAITDAMKEALQENGITTDALMLGEKPSHEETEQFMACREYVDLLIPRGSKRLIRTVVEHAKIPVIETGAGVCHVYVDATADFDMADKIILNAKLSRPSVCNAMETLLVNKQIAQEYLPRITGLLKEKGVSIYADESSRAIVEGLMEATDESYHTEYNDLIMNLRIVKDVDQAIEHIETYGTHHSDAIVTNDTASRDRFMSGIDSACVYHNASTRFTDGFEFGLGAEIGISTQKLHARGPMGLNELTTYAYQLEGKGETR